MVESKARHLSLLASVSAKAKAKNRGVKNCPAVFLFTFASANCGRLFLPKPHGAYKCLCARLKCCKALSGFQSVLPG